MAAVKHVQDRRAHMRHQLALQRTTIVIFHAGRDVPKADVFAAGANTAPAPDALVAEVRAVFVFVLVLARVDAVRPQRDLPRRTVHTDGRTAGNGHQFVPRRVHTHPVEDGAGIDIIAALAHAPRTVNGSVIPDCGDVKSGGTAQQ